MKKFNFSSAILLTLLCVSTNLHPMGSSPVESADIAVFIKNGDLKGIENKCKQPGFDINTKSIVGGDYPLNLALKTNNKDVVKLLMDKGAKLQDTSFLLFSQFNQSLLNLKPEQKPEQKVETDKDKEVEKNKNKEKLDRKKKLNAEIARINLLRGDKETKAKMVEQTKAKYDQEERRENQAKRFQESKFNNNMVVELPKEEDIVDKECSICFEEFSNGKAVVCIDCMHKFHKDCVDKWFEGKEDVVCPICKEKAVTYKKNKKIEEDEKKSKELIDKLLREEMQVKNMQNNNMRSSACDFGQEVKNENLVANEKWVKINGKQVNMPANSDVVISLGSREIFTINNSVQIKVPGLWQDLSKLVIDVRMDSGTLALPGVPYRCINIISNNPKYKEQLSELINKEKKMIEENIGLCKLYKNQKWVKINGQKVEVAMDKDILIEGSQNGVLVNRTFVQVEGIPSIEIRMDTGSYAINGLAIDFNKFKLITMDQNFMEESLGRLRNGLVKISGK